MRALRTSLKVTLAAVASLANVDVARAEGDLSETIKYIGEYVPGDVEGLEKLLEANPNESLATILFGHGDIDEDPYETLGNVRLSFEKMRPAILDAARRYDVPPGLIDAVIRTESGYRPEAVSRTGARGLMQLMPQTAREMGVQNSFDPKQNILGGTKYLKKMIDKFGSIPLAVAAYNAGPGNVMKHNGIPPFKETRAYVKTVMFRYKGSPLAKDQYRYDSGDPRGKREDAIRPADKSDDRTDEPESDSDVADDVWEVVR